MSKKASWVVCGLLSLLLLAPAAQAKTSKVQRVTGWALISPTKRISGGHVVIRTLDGRRLSTKADADARTSKQGTFSVRVTSLPKRYIVSIVGGKVGSRKLGGTLRAIVFTSEERTFADVNPVTELLYKRYVRRGDRKKAEADVRRVLDLPKGIDVKSAARTGTHYFDGTRFLRTARAAKGVNRYATSITTASLKKRSFRGTAPKRTPVAKRAAHLATTAKKATTAKMARSAATRVIRSTIPTNNNGWPPDPYDPADYNGSSGTPSELPAPEADGGTQTDFDDWSDDWEDIDATEDELAGGAEGALEDGAGDMLKDLGGGLFDAALGFAVEQGLSALGLNFGESNDDAEILSQLSEIQARLQEIQAQLTEIQGQLADLSAQTAAAEYAELTADLKYGWVSTASDNILTDLQWLIDNGLACQQSSSTCQSSTPIPSNVDPLNWCQTSTAVKTAPQFYACDALETIKSDFIGNSSWNNIANQLYGQHGADGVIGAFLKWQTAELQKNGGFVTNDYQQNAAAIVGSWAWVVSFGTMYQTMYYDTEDASDSSASVTAVNNAQNDVASLYSLVPWALPANSAVDPRTGKLWVLAEQDPPQKLWNQTTAAPAGVYNCTFPSYQWYPTHTVPATLNLPGTGSQYLFWGPGSVDNSITDAQFANETQAQECQQQLTNVMANTTDTNGNDDLFSYGDWTQPTIGDLQTLFSQRGGLTPVQYMTQEMALPDVSGAKNAYPLPSSATMGNPSNGTSTNPGSNLSVLALGSCNASQTFNLWAGTGISIHAQACQNLDLTTGQTRTQCLSANLGDPWVQSTGATCGWTSYIYNGGPVSLDFGHPNIILGEYPLDGAYYYYLATS